MFFHCHVPTWWERHERSRSKTRELVAVEPRRPPKTNVGTQIAFRRDHWKPRGPIQKSKHLWGQTSVDTIKLAYIFNYIDLHAQHHRFRPKTETISEVRVHAGTKFGHTGCWSIVKCSQSSCQNYTGGFRSWPPATCRFSTRRSFDHHGKGNGNFV